jgi:uncharacterized membrane protein YgcG
MERNSLGQVIVNESGSAIISIPCKEQFITINQYNRFLLDNKEFTELTPTIDKDAVIASLTSELNSALQQIYNSTPNISISGSISSGGTTNGGGGTSGGGGGNTGKGNVAPL